MWQTGNILHLTSIVMHQICMTTSYAFNFPSYASILSENRTNLLQKGISLSRKGWGKKDTPAKEAWLLVCVHTCSGSQSTSSQDWLPNCYQEELSPREVNNEKQHSVLWFGNALIFEVISEVLQTLEWLQLVALFWSSIWIWKTHGNFDKISCVAKCTVPVETTTGASSILISFKHNPVLERTWPREQRTKSTTINYMNFP